MVQDVVVVYKWTMEDSFPQKEPCAFLNLRPRLGGFSLCICARGVSKVNPRAHGVSIDTRSDTWSDQTAIHGPLRSAWRNLSFGNEAPEANLQKRKRLW